MTVAEGRLRRVMIAEDDSISRRLLQVTLEKAGYAVEEQCDGSQAWERLQKGGAPSLVILDWMMPVMDGLEVCRRLRSLPDRPPSYVILLTAKGRKEDLVEGLTAGADDYLTKPFDARELLARLQVGTRLLDLQDMLASRVRDLEEALAQVKLLRGLMPICSYCKSIRDDNNYWQQIESYLAEHSEAQFSHGICPTCYQRFIQPELESLGRLVKGVTSAGDTDSARG